MNLGRRTPTDWQHVEKYPMRAVMRSSVATVNNTLKLPGWHWSHDQGHEGSCIGHGSSMMMSLLNGRRYNPLWLWDRSKEIDEWADTNPGDDNGTSVRASCDVLRDQGHVRVYAGQDRPVALKEGISENRWATTVDEMRSALAQSIPVSIGVNWYTRFDSPEGGWMARKGDDLGTIRGGHCLCVYGASDRYQAFRAKNSWGRSYPLVWLPYEIMERLLNEDGEASLVVDRP